MFFFCFQNEKSLKKQYKKGGFFLCLLQVSLLAEGMEIYRVVKQSLLNCTLQTFIPFENPELKICKPHQINPHDNLELYFSSIDHHFREKKW